MSPLLTAFENGHVHVAKLLIIAGASIDYQDEVLIMYGQIAR